MNILNRAILGTLVVGSLSLASGAMAQWSKDPAVALNVTAQPATQGVPLTRANADGSVWVYFYENNGTGYRPIVQRLNEGGRRLFAGNGIVLANRTNSATFISDFKTDAAGNAYATYDLSTGLYVQKITPAGDTPWNNTGGILLPGSAGFLNAKVTACPDGTIVAYYSNGFTLNFSRHDGATGAVLNTWTYSEGPKAISPSDLGPGSTGGECIAMWVRSDSTSSNGNKGLKIQKFGTTGNQIWNGGVPIDMFASAPGVRGLGFAYFPSFTPDGQGGVVCAWYNGGLPRVALLQHVLADGTQRMPQNGAPVSNVNEIDLSASVGYDRDLFNPANDQYVVAYERSLNNQATFSLAAQRFTVGGGRLWGDGGLGITPEEGTHKSFVSALSIAGHDSIITWIDYSGANFPMTIKATRLDPNGLPVWPTGIVQINSTQSSKGRLSVVGMPSGRRAVATWTDDTSGVTRVVSQSFNYDATFGCVPDVAQLGGGAGPDGQISVDDLIFYLGAFFSNDLTVADIATLGGSSGPDGQVSVDDLIYYLSLFFSGCN